jgi:hypothetical protein
MLSPPSGPHGMRPASRRTDSAQRCDVHTSRRGRQAPEEFGGALNPGRPEGRTTTWATSISKLQYDGARSLYRCQAVR